MYTLISASTPSPSSIPKKDLPIHFTLKGLYKNHLTLGSISELASNGALPFHGSSRRLCSHFHDPQHIMTRLPSLTMSNFSKRKSHGLPDPDPYEIPLPSPKKTNLTLSARRLKMCGLKRVKSALRVGGAFGNRTSKDRENFEDGIRIHGHEYEKRTRRVRFSLPDDITGDRGLEESPYRSENALEDVTEKTRNRLMDVALKTLYATREVSCATEEPNTTEKDGDGLIRRLTPFIVEPRSRDTIMGGHLTSTSDGNNCRTEAPKEVVQGGYDTQLPDTEELNLASTSGTSIESDTIVDRETLINTNTETNSESPASTQIFSGSSTSLGYAIRTPVPYPEFGYSDPVVTAGAENATTHYPSSEFATDVIDNDISNDKITTGGGKVELIKGHRIYEGVSIIPAQ